MILGVDYASVDANARPNFVAARHWGARFAVIRAAFTFGSSAHVDPTWARDHASARAAGLQVAPYLVLGWNADPSTQVDQLVAAYGTAGRADLPAALDIEGFPGVPPAQALAKVEAAVSALRRRYRMVTIYTSCARWSEQLGDLPSTICGSCPLWLKVGYPWNAHNAPHVEAIPPVTEVPRPWRAVGSPGAFLEQFQGDAIGVPGFTRTVDLNVFLPYVASASEPRTAWVRATLAAKGLASGAGPAPLAATIRAFQAAHGLEVDGVIGPVTWAEMCGS